jgi:hypothetical protein
MEITNLDNPIDDELIAELRDLTDRVEGLLDRVRTDRFPSLNKFDLGDLPYRITLLDESAGFLN